VKNIYVIPATGKQVLAYSHLTGMLTELGYNVIPVHVTWGNLVLPEIIGSVSEQLTDTVADDDIVLGSSFGANIATMFQYGSNPKIIACSAANLEGDKHDRDFLDRMADRNLDWSAIEEVVTQYPVHNNIHFIAGNRERPFRVFAKTLSQRHNGSLDIIPHARHNINSAEYVAGLKDIFERKYSP